VNNFITVSDITLFALSYLFVRTAISSKLKVLCCGGGCSHIDSATFLWCYRRCHSCLLPNF